MHKDDKELFPFFIRYIFFLHNRDYFFNCLSKDYLKTEKIYEKDYHLIIYSFCVKIRD